MICRYSLQLEGRIVPQFWAYRLYAWLLSQLPEDVASQIHEQSGHPISQYIDRGIWKVTLFGEDVIQAVAPVLESSDCIKLNTDLLQIRERWREDIPGAQHFLQTGKNLTSNRREIQIVSPMSFKTAGRYAIYPREELLVQSLLKRWNACFPEFLLEDPDLEATLLQGIHIVDYSLRTSRFQLKNGAIPCFAGRIFLESKLPAVLQELWNSLMYFGCYSGIGIKTTLGMGGIQLLDLDKKTQEKIGQV